MKLFTCSVAAAVALSTFAVAGGDLKDVEPVISPVAEIVEPDEGGFYIGGAYSSVSLERDVTEEYMPDSGMFEEHELDFDALMLQVGYSFNKYIAVEGRYWSSIGDAEYKYHDGSFYGNDRQTYNSDEGETDEVEFDAWGIYVKPMYPVTDELNIYGLLGYADTTVEDNGEHSESGFSWGLGASYDITDNLSIFADYVLLYDDSEREVERVVTTEDIHIDTWNFGLTYNF